MKILSLSILITITALTSSVSSANQSSIQIGRGDCDKYSKIELFKTSVLSFDSKDNANYINAMHCLREKDIHDSEFIELIYRFHNSDNELYYLEIAKSLRNGNLELVGGDHFIHFAVENDFYNVTKRILEIGADANIKSTFNHLPLGVSTKKDIKLFELLLNNTTLNKRDSIDVATDIISSSEADKIARMKLLLNSNNFSNDPCMLQQLMTYSDSKGHTEVSNLISSFLNDK